MRDENLVEPFAVQEFFVDGFTGHEVHNGILTCAGYRLMPPSHESGDVQKVVVVRVVMPANNIPEMQARTRAALGGALVAAICEKPKFVS